MLVQVLKRFEGAKKSMFEAGQVLDLECRNLQGLIDYNYLAPLSTDAAPAAPAAPAPVLPPPPDEAKPRARKARPSVAEVKR